MKKIFALAILITAVLVSACGQQNNRSKPHDDINTICKAYLQMDLESLQKIGLDKVDCDETFTNLIIGGVTSGNEGDLNFGQQIAVWDSLHRIYQNTKYSAVTISETGDKATVKLTVSTYTPLFNEKYFTYQVFASLPDNIFDFNESTTSEVFTDALISTFDEMQIVGDADITVECMYDQALGMWMPVDLEYFKRFLIKTIFGIQ